MPDRPLVEFSLDGKTVSAPEGSLVIDAAKTKGVEVPHYCYHPALGNPGVCRLCLVEVEGAPKLQASCRLPVKAGMVVRTNSAKARKGQASSLELHLVNHPLDCPVCDQAGECKLQDYYMTHGLYKSSVREDKVHKDKRLPIGPNIMLDNERCILCTRCTRFLDQVTHTNELGIFNRGDRDILLPYPGKQVDNAYAGNIVDICPVGALTDRDFRFKVRAWYLEETASVCDGCARGCSIEIHANLERGWHTPGERVARFKPRFNPEVNGYWMCDEGRYSYKRIDSRLRLKAASRLTPAGPTEVPWTDASARLAAELSALTAARGAAGLAVVLSGTLSNEDLWAAKTLFVDKLKAGWFLVKPGPDQLGEEDAILRRKEKVPNHKGAESVGFGSAVKETTWDGLLDAIRDKKVWGLYVVDRDPITVWGEEGRKAIAGLAFTAYQGSLANEFAHAAQWVLPACSFAEEDGTVTNFEGQVQRLKAAIPRLGDSRPDWEIFRDLLVALGQPTPWDSPERVFGALALGAPAFAGQSWSRVGPTGRKLGAKDPAERPGERTVGAAS